MVETIVCTGTGPLVVGCEEHYKNILQRFFCQFKLGVNYLVEPLFETLFPNTSFVFERNL